MSTARADKNSNPFPGLRPFRHEEAYLFFGRERQVDAMVDTLAGDRFLAVVGTSGSGKSSLVNCGLVPALHRGLMADAGTAWRLAHMRPGIDPIGNLASALCNDGVLFEDYEEDAVPLKQVVETNLRMSKLGLVDVVEQARLGDGVNLVVVVDQFEELFRYAKLAETGTLDTAEINQDSIVFVNLLLEAAAHTKQPIYVVLTMRSDFLGDCSKFHGLPEAINAGQFLVPRLTREERRAAIVGPVRVAGAGIKPVLVTRLVNDASDNPDQLSVLQHALNRTWAHWQNDCNGKGIIGLEHYEAIGTISDALNHHADRAFSELESVQERGICERVFKALTDRATDPRGIRRPTRFKDLVTIADDTQAEVTQVLRVFRKPSRSFLMPPADEALDDKTVIDISHESLMRGWQQLRDWADEEAQSAQHYQRIADTGELYRHGDASLMRDPELQLAIDWREKQQPIKAWAAQYGGRFAETMGFLDDSSSRREEERAEIEAEYSRKRRRRIYGAAAVNLVILAAFAASLLLKENKRIDTARVVAEKTSEAQKAQRTTELGDPVRGALIALRGLQGLQAQQNEATPHLESALWQAHAASQLQRVLKDHDREVRGLAFGKQGTLLASGSNDGRAQIYDTSTWQRIVEIDEDKDAGDAVLGSRVLGLAFSPSGGQLATGSWSYHLNPETDARQRVGRIRLWSAETGKLTREFTAGPEAVSAHDAPVRTVRFDKSGTLLTSSSYDKTARVWNVETGQLVNTLRGHKIAGRGVDVYGAAFHPFNSAIVATVGNDAKLRVWNIADAVHGSTIESDETKVGGHDHRIRSVAFSPDGTRIVTASDDDTVRLWDYQNKRQDGRPLAAHGADIWRAIFDDRGRYLFTASWDRTVGIWDAATFNRLAVLRGHSAPVRTLAYDRFNQRLATGGRDRTTRIWSLEADDVVTRLEAQEKNVTAVRINPAEPREFATASDDGTIRITRLGSDTHRLVIEYDLPTCGYSNWTPNCEISQLAYAGDGLRLAARYADNSLRIWDTTRGEIAGATISSSSQSEFGKFQLLQALPDRDLVAVATRKENNAYIVYYSMRAAVRDERPALDVLDLLKSVPEYREATSVRVSALHYHAGRKALAIGLRRGIVLIVDVETGELSGPLVNVKRNVISGVRFSDDGKTLFAAADDWVVEAWDLATNERISEMTGHQGAIRDMALIDGGRRLVTGSSDEVIRIWDPATGRQIVELPGHSGTIRSLAVTTDAGRTYLVSTSEDDSILVRNIYTNLQELTTSVCTKMLAKNLAAGDYIESPKELDELCHDAGL